MNDVNPRAELPRAVTCAAVSLCVALVAAPVALGGTAVWPRCALECVIAAAVIAWALWCRPPLQQAGPAFIPLLVGGLQLTPLPTALLLAIAPVSAAAWVVANSGGPAAWGRISIAPHVTLVACARLFLAVAAIVAVVDLARHDRFRRWFSVALCVSGLVIWGLGLAFSGRPTDRVVLGIVDLKGPIESWKNPIRPAMQTNGVGYVDWFKAGQTRYQFDAGIIGDGFGPFIYSNHFAAAASLTLPFVLAWIVMLLRSRAPRIVVTVVVLATITAAVWTAGAMAHSRAGSVCLLLGSMVFLAMSASRPSSRLAAAVCAAVCAVGICALAVILYGRIEGVSGFFPPSLQKTVDSLTVDSRAMATAAAFRMFAASPAAGTGLGTYSLVFPRVAPGGYVFYYAHNDYAQWLAETGIIGASLAGAAAAWLVYRVWRSPRKDTANNAPLHAAACAAVAGIASHSLFDWNLHIPANAFLACVAAGMALQGDTDDSRRAVCASDPGSRTGALGAGLLVVCSLAAAILAGRDAVSEAAQRNLRSALVAAQMAGMDSSRPLPIPLLEAASAAGERMTRWDPANAHLEVLTGQAHEQLAALADDQAVREQHAKEAASRFNSAQRHCAMVRGIPEPINAATPSYRKP